MRASIPDAPSRHRSAVSAPQLSARDAEAEMLRRLWMRHREDVARRVDVLGRAVALLNEGRGDPVVAHTLAGSVGMFGFHVAAQAAADLERKLTPGHDAAFADMCDALARLHADIDGDLPGAEG
jgi:HPt (histidine-containing phosphotransfer) domain-containing protein